MTEFDRLLQEAFQAGYERGAFEAAGYGEHTAPPDFETWRAMLAERST